MLKPFALGGYVVGFCLLLASPAGAQQRPLVTEDPETIGAGLVLVEGGIDYARELFLPASGLNGNLLQAPLIGISIGVGSIVELQFDGGFYNRLAVAQRDFAPLSARLDFEGDSTRDVEDLVVATKVRIVDERTGRPAVGIRFATKLPNASTASGLGLDTTDFLVALLVGKTIQSVRIVGNVGVGILADPVRADRQNDVLLWGGSFARAVAEGVEMVGEINGRLDTRAGEPPPGTENRGMMRLGMRYTRGAGRVDAGLLVGMTSRDPTIGFTAGFTYVFRAFQVP